MAAAPDAGRGFEISAAGGFAGGGSGDAAGPQLAGRGRGHGSPAAPGSGVGLISAAAAVAGHYLGAGLAIRGGGRLVRPAVVIVLLLLTVKMGSELLAAV